VQARKFEAAYGVQYTSLEELLRESDVVTLHCPYVPENHYLINRQTLSMMKDGAYLSMWPGKAG
jgi:lactate dehydrogenase-like 2-hydroxyacid dehydrogenase